MRHEFEHPTKTKGDLGLYKARLAMYEAGFLILNPDTEHAPFDLVIYRDKKFYTVQVKCRSVTNTKRKSAGTGYVSVLFGSIAVNTNRTNVKRMDKSVVDIVCIYCIDSDTCYYVNPRKYNKIMSIRINDPINRQKSGVNMGKDFMDVNVAVESVEKERRDEYIKS